MKMNKIMFAELEELISEVKVKYTFWDKLLADIEKNPDVKSVGRRFIWDIYYLIDREKRFDWSDRATLYGLNKPHLETTLKRIVPKYFPMIQPYMEGVK